jgi:hypothetical protein
MKLSSLLKWGVALFLLVILAGVALSNYSAGIYLAVGIVILIGISIIVHNLGWKIMLIIAAGVSIFALINVVTISIPITISPIIMCTTGTTKTELELTEYTAEVDAVSFKEGSFRVTEHVTYNKQESTCDEAHLWEVKVIQEDIVQDLPSRSIQSSGNGLFVHEVIIPVELNDFECCPSEANVVIKGFPYKSFYDAQNVDSLKVDEYLGNETITWQPSYLLEGIRFAYLPSPFYNVRMLVTPFIELSKYDNWILAAFGFVISSIFLLIIKPNVFGFINEKAKNIFKKDDAPRRKPPKRKMNRN